MTRYPVGVPLQRRGHWREHRKARLRRREGRPTDRILASGITERFTRGARGELVLLTPGSTEPVVETRHHAGIVTVERWDFSLT
jgi:hypothetical protein